MNTYKLSNIPLKTMIRFLEHQGLKHISTDGGHAKYTRGDLKQTYNSTDPYFSCTRIYNPLKYSNISAFQKNHFMSTFRRIFKFQ